MEKREAMNLGNIIKADFCPVCRNCKIISDTSIVFFGTYQERLGFEEAKLPQVAKIPLELKLQAEAQKFLKLGPISTQCTKDNHENDMFFGFDVGLFLSKNPKARIVDYACWNGLAFDNITDEASRFEYLSEFGTYRYDADRPRIILVKEVDLTKATCLLYDSRISAAFIGRLGDEIKGLKAVPGYEKIKEFLSLSQGDGHVGCTCK
ncbi:hypothetical protein KY311_02510 [Candidatus Woesearchaeota archaeon]|nr:hypothetical protein [Candidatus Woesearchaeota archaeon]